MKQTLKIIHTQPFDAVEIPPSKQVLTLFAEKGIFPANKDTIEGAQILQGVRLIYIIPDAFLKKDEAFETRFIPLGKGMWLVVSFPKGSQLVSQNSFPLFFVKRPPDKRKPKYPVVGLILGDKKEYINPKKVLGAK